jgi:hypothetical protein
VVEPGFPMAGTSEYLILNTWLQRGLLKTKRRQQ